LGASLIKLSNNPTDNWTNGDAFENTVIFGGTGGGKSSTSAAALARAFLTAGFGGLVMCAKPDEASRWENYARVCGRGSAVIRFDATGRYRFNFLDYLMSSTKSSTAGLVDNAVQAFLQILEATHSPSGSGDAGTNDFWRKSMRDLLANAIAVLYHAYGRVQIDELLQLINSAPTLAEQAQDPDYQTWSFCYATIKRLFHDPKVPLPDREAAQYATYFGQTFGRLDGKTRSNMVITLSAEIGQFLRGPLHTLFCTHTNIVPEVTHEGVILILDLPIKRFDHVGTVAQVLMKYIWQKATERRAVGPDTRPVFLFADEAQLFISSYDLEFLSTARSARAATVYITQNLPSLYARLGGHHPQDRADAILGNFQTKIFHANTDPRTNQWASEMIGKRLHRRASGNWSDGWSEQASEGSSGNWSHQEGTSKGRSSGSSAGGTCSGQRGTGQFTWGVNSGRNSGTSESHSRGSGWSTGTSAGISGSEGGGWSEQMDYAVPPAFFANGLRQGGERNNFFVSAILLQANRVFSLTGSCWTPLVYRQR
jgi:hypothetical protein